MDEEFSYRILPLDFPKLLIEIGQIKKSSLSAISEREFCNSALMLKNCPRSAHTIPQRILTVPLLRRIIAAASVSAHWCFSRQ